MYLIWLMGRTLNSERRTLLFGLVNTLALVLIYNLLLDTIDIVYPLFVSFMIWAVYFVVKAFALHNFFTALDDAKAGSIPEGFAESYKEQRVMETIEAIHVSYQGQLATMHEKLEGRNSLFSQFVHNMKSSVAVIELAGSKQSTDVLADIQMENDKLKANLEQSLNLLRLDEFSNDYVPESVDLNALVSSVINEKRRDFIYARVFPKLTGEATYVYTDRKWCSYLLDQLITNAIKYSRPETNVYFEIEADPQTGRTKLQIRDEGEGIDPSDLPRVFELFYTGQNGRTKPNATGIGLAMVKLIAKKLGHEVSLTSAVGQGTCVTISFLSKM